jgi:GT2 family glycosyltransferase
MSEPLTPEIEITVAVVPREKFSYCSMTLDAVLANTSLPFKLLYIDGGSPRPTRDEIKKKLEGRPNTRLLRYEHFLGPFQSRNIAIQEADPKTKYLVILDNDNLVRPGWLENLHRCAEEENAGAVVPLVLLGGPDTDEIHHAGGDSGVHTNEAGELEFEHRQHLEFHQTTDVADQLHRGPTRLLEDHCIFARTEVWKQLTLDARLPLMTSVPEMSAAFQKTGAKLMMEPSARVVYLWGKDAPLKASDIPTWYMAWSNKWSRYYMRERAGRYGVARSEDEKRHVAWWLGNHRRVPLFPLMDGITGFFHRLKLDPLGKVLVKLTEQIEDGISYLIVEWVRVTPAGRAIGCPSLFAPYPSARAKGGSSTVGQNQEVTTP